MKERVVVVFGMGPAGLFLSRQLKRDGATVVAIGKSDDIGRYSNAISLFYEAESKPDVAKAVDCITTRFGEKLEAWICSDQYLTLFIEEYPEAFSLMNFKNPGEGILRLIAEKEALMDYCSGIGVRFPEQYSADNLRNVEYPVAIKPNIKHGTSPIKKINFAENENDLKLLLSFAGQHNLASSQLIIQKAIVGDNGSEYGYGGYFLDGEVVNDVYFIQARQYPQGVCCYTVELTDVDLKREIAEQTHKLIRALKYSGFIQFDLKKDANSHKMYVLDINPRPWGSVSMLTKKCRQNGVFEPNPDIDERICWRFPIKELMAFSNKNNVSYSKCSKMKGGNKYITMVDLWDKHDIKPFLMQPVITIKKLIKRV